MCASEVSAIRGSLLLGRKTNLIWSFVVSAEAALEEASGAIANGYLRSDREEWIRAVEKRRAARPPGAPDLTYEWTRGSGGMRPVMITPAPG
jgi:hypothetical protein